jgi:tRNA(fMet)-specific endonuclease VapC
MKYLLDTCIISHFVKGTPSVLRKIKAISPNLLCVSSISCMEIEYGLNINPQRAIKIRPIVNMLLNSIQKLPYVEEDAIATANIRSFLKQQGTPIGHYDIMLAGCAQNRGLIMVTDNVREFQRVDNLIIENWVDEINKTEEFK